MDMSSLFRTQLISSSTNPILNSFLLTGIDIITKYAEEIIKYYLEKYKSNSEKKLKNFVSNITDNSSVLILEKSFKDKNNIEINNDTDTDAVLHFISNLSHVKGLYLNNFNKYIFNCRDEFEIDTDIKCKLISSSKSELSIETISIQLSSSVLNMKEIRDFVTKCKKNYLIEKKNKLGKGKYFFNQIRGLRDTECTFSRHEFSTNRTFENIFFNDKEELEKRIKIFHTDKSWYDKRGIPHSLGLLFHGIPGAGKTSSIKAIAKYTNRHIININTSYIKTKTQLTNLFYETKINVIFEGQTEILEIPLNERLYIFEDVDCMGASLFERTSQKYKDYQKQQKEFKEKMNNTANQMNINTKTLNTDKDEIDLSVMLNILDGTLEIPGRIVIFTSNHPDQLDNALIRPGRIDMIINFKHTNTQVFKDLYKLYLEKNPSDKLLKIFPDNFWSPSHAARFLFKHINSDEKIIYNELLKEIELKKNEEIELKEKENELKKNEEIESKEKNLLNNLELKNDELIKQIETNKELIKQIEFNEKDKTLSKKELNNIKKEKENILNKIKIKENEQKQIKMDLAYANQFKNYEFNDNDIHDLLKLSISEREEKLDDRRMFIQLKNKLGMRDTENISTINNPVGSQSNKTLIEPYFNQEGYDNNNTENNELLKMFS